MWKGCLDGIWDRWIYHFEGQTIRVKGGVKGVGCQGLVWGGYSWRVEGVLKRRTGLMSTKRKLFSKV